MARLRNKLSARTVAALSKAGKHGDGGGLYLRIDQTAGVTRRRWIYVFTWGGKLREMGLGGFPEVSLAGAREARDKAERQVKEGLDPIAARDNTNKNEAAKPAFGDEVQALLKAKSPEWRNDKHRAQWHMTLNHYAAPLHPLAVEDVDTAAILGVLEPLWQAKPETASRLRGRIETVLDAARARGNIPQNQANPARWKGHLDKLLPKRRKLTRGHHAAMPYRDVPEFVARLHEGGSMAALCLEFTILTAARSGESLGAAWLEIDLMEKIWTVPAVRMKAGRIHRVPLPLRAVAILEKLAEARVNGFVFPGQRREKPLSSMALEMLLRRMNIVDATVHGMRSAFRDWAGDETDFPRELAEAALAHSIGDAAEQAYRRGDAIEKRRKLMEAWANYCCQTGAAGHVIEMRAAGGS